MKKLLLASAIAALSVSAAQAAPTVYGKAFLTLDAVNTDVDGADDETNTSLNSNSSRIGIKGSEAITANTDVVYQLEYGVDIDADDKNDDKNDDKEQFYARDTYLGLANKQYGTVMAGRLTSIDDYVNFTTDLPSANLVDGIAPAFNGERLNNALAYVSPNYNGMTFMAEYGLDGDQDDLSYINEEQYGVAALYNQGPLNLGASYIGAGDVNFARIAAGYQLTPAVNVGGIYQRSDLDTDEKENAFALSAELQTQTPWLVYTKGVMIDNVGGAKDHDKFGVTVGGKYAFSKAATGHVYTAYTKEEMDKSSSDVDQFGIGAGLEYKF